jgi:hypothetical protein
MVALERYPDFTRGGEEITHGYFRKSERNDKDSLHSNFF